MKRSWRLIDSGFQTAAYNMSLDSRLFEKALAETDFSPTLRIYGFQHAAVTCGYSQKELAQKIKPELNRPSGLPAAGSYFTEPILPFRWSLRDLIIPAFLPLTLLTVFFTKSSKMRL